MRTVGIELFLTDDGAEARGLVSHLGWIIGMGAEIAANAAPASALAKRQHAALRNVVELATDGCRWRASLAEPLWAAAQEANSLLIQHPRIGLAVQPAADQLAVRIRSRRASLADVAGAEIYAQTEALELAA